MQVERARYSASPVLSEAAAPPAGAYAFPPPRTANGDEHLNRNAAASPAPSEYQRPRTGEGNFSYAALPPSSSHGHPDDRQRSMPEEYQQPRSMSTAGLHQMEEEYRSQAAAQSRAQGVASPAPGGYSALGRTVIQGGPVHEVMAQYEYAPYAHERQHYVQSGTYAHYRPHPYGTAAPPPPPGHPFARGAAYAAGPPSHLGAPTLDWAKPRMSQDDSVIGTTASSFSNRHFGSAPHTPRIPGGPPPLPGAHGHPAYYSPYPGLNMGMVRSTSNQSGLSSLSESTTAESHYSSTDYEAHVNPSFLNQGYYHAGGDSGYYSSASAGDLHGVANLRLDGSSLTAGGSGHSYSTRTRSASGRDKNATVRASSSRTIKAASPSSYAAAGAKPKRRTASTIYHPSPAAMLAPGVFTPSAGAMAAEKKGKPSRLPGTNSPALPSDAEFAKMPTKRSRGRRPPSTPDLDVDVEDPNKDPSEAQLEYVGRTKTGKPRKVFLCKVPGCGKCFKRSEHLKRHVRSIHTNEKPFQCQWPGCARFFSRHDNLNQHLRIHREPNMTDEDFSAALKECFDRRLREVEREKALALRREREEQDDDDDEEAFGQEEHEHDERVVGQEVDADGDVEDGDGGGSDYNPNDPHA
ncbi:hypothetical protein JCM11251_001220 [Rhodosporidiobolus azoricus]